MSWLYTLRPHKCRRVDSSVHQENLKEDIVIEILLRLPIKSLARFRCTSKKWNNFFNGNSYFPTRYKNMGGSLSPPLMLSLGFFCQSTFYDIGFIATSDQGILLQKHISCIESGKLVGASNGFLLVGVQLSIPAQYFIVNPITMKNNYLCYVGHTKKGRITTAFLCKDEHSDLPLQYKVVRARIPFARYSQTLVVESLSSAHKHEWRKLDLTCPSAFELNPNNDPAIISDSSGITYFPATEVHTSLPCVLAFDDRQDHCLELQMIVLPKDITAPKEEDGYCSCRRGRGRHRSCPLSGKYRSCFGQTNGLIVYGLCFTHRVEVWVLDESNKKWSMNYVVKDTEIQMKQQLGIAAFHPLDHYCLLINMKDDKKAWYNVKSKKTDVVSFKVVEENEYSDHSLKFDRYTCPYICPAAVFLFRAGTWRF